MDIEVVGRERNATGRTKSLHGTDPSLVISTMGSEKGPGYLSPPTVPIPLKPIALIKPSVRYITEIVPQCIIPKLKPTPQ